MYIITPDGDSIHWEKLIFFSGTSAINVKILRRPVKAAVPKDTLIEGIFKKLRNEIGNRTEPKLTGKMMHNIFCAMKQLALEVMSRV